MLNIYELGEKEGAKYGLCGDFNVCVVLTKYKLLNLIILITYFLGGKEMNKFLVGLGISCLLFSAGCSSKKEVVTKQKIEQQEQSHEKNTKVNFPIDAKETGEASMKVITNHEQKEEESTPILKVDPKLGMAQIQLELEGLNEKEAAYIFVDQKLITKEEVTKVFSTFINLEGDLLKDGEHTVAIVQFKDNTSKKELKNYKEAKFKIEQGTVESV